MNMHDRAKKRDKKIVDLQKKGLVNDNTGKMVEPKMLPFGGAMAKFMADGSRKRN